MQSYPCPCCGQDIEGVIPIRELPKKLGRLTPSQRQILEFLILRMNQYSSIEFISKAIGASEHTAETQIGNLKKLIKPFGWYINNKYSVGYRLSSATKEQEKIDKLKINAPLVSYAGAE